MDTSSDDGENVFLNVDTKDIRFSMQKIEFNLLGCYAGTNIESRCYSYIKSLQKVYGPESDISRN